LLFFDGPFFPTGELDFYVDGELGWAIELLVEMGGRTEHLKRFEGVYAPLKIPAANIRFAGVLLLCECHLYNWTRTDFWLSHLPLIFVPQ